MTAPHPDDELVDLALGHVSAERRSALAEHLAACPRCRRSHDDLVAGIEAVTATAPPVQPPLGFDERVLAAGGARTAPAPPPGPVLIRGRRPRGWWVGAAAAAVLVLVLGALGGGRWAGRDDGTDDRVAALTTGAGRDVGTATVTEVGGEPVLVVGLTAGREGATHTCRMRFADGSTLATEPWAAVAGAGWLVPLPEDRGPLTGIELVAPDTGAPWSTADLAG